MSAPSFAAELTRHKRAALLVAGAALLLAGCWSASGAYHAREEARKVESVDPWTERASFEYSVPVTRNSTHWPIGTRLPMGEPAYFRTISDSIDVTFGWTADLPEGARGVAAASLAVQVRAQDVEGRPYWSVEHPLDDAVADDARGGVSLAGTIDLDALVQEVDALTDELPPGEGVTNWSVRAKVVYAVEIAGRRDQQEVEYAIPIGANDPRFFLPKPEELAWSSTHAEERTIVSATHAGTAGVLRSGSSLMLLAGGAIAIVLGALLAPGGAGGAFEREYRKYQDWVSVAGAIPDSARNGAPLVDVGTLEDLVHVASDARTRVLLDSGTREFYALLPGVTYRYAKHATTPASG
jgi:hypothetical protein